MIRRARRQGDQVGGLHFDKFTERARSVMTLAQQEARELGHSRIGTEHVLLGLLREGEGVGARVLANLSVEAEPVRTAIVDIIGRGDHAVAGEIGVTPRVKKAIELAVDEARRLGHRYIGTEHLLLGLVREGDGIAGKVLQSLGIGLDRARNEVVVILAGITGGSKETGPRNNVITCRLDDHAGDAIDALVEAGIRSTRSDAAAWLIAAGIEAHQALFSRVYATVAEIRQLRADAQVIAQQMAGGEAPPSDYPPSVAGR